MQKKRNKQGKSVTLPILLPCASEEMDGVSNFLPGEEQMNPVRGLWDDDLTQKTKRGKRMWNSLNDEQRKVFLNMTALKQALDGSDGTALQKAYENLDSALIGIPPPPPLSGFDASEYTHRYARFMAKLGLEPGSGSVERYLAQLLTATVSDAKFVSWYFDDGGVLLPAVYCPRPATALFVQAVFRLQEALANRGICRCCDKPFKRKRPNQKDFNKTHGARYRMRTMRIRKAALKASQER
jgi:hypothetical protein